jgi:uncharacterized membrane protein YkvA (DUF1232 family)
MNFSIQSFYNWYRNTLRHPKYRWLVILGTLAYLVSPLDIAPDFLPILGQVDDIMLLTLLVSEVSQLVMDYGKSRQTVATADETDRSQAVDVEAIPVE